MSPGPTLACCLANVLQCHFPIYLQKNGVGRGQDPRGTERHLLTSPLRVPLRRHPSLRKKLRARGQLSEFWKAQNLDMIQYTEACTATQGANEPLINYMDVRSPGAGAGGGGGGGMAWPVCMASVGQQH